MKRIGLLVLLMALLVFVPSCKKGQKQNNNNITGTCLMDSLKQAEQKFDEQKFFESIDQSKVAAINQIIAGFISPVEFAATIKDYHIPFSKNYLAPLSLADNYDINLKKALGLGVYSADLGYLNIYHKNSQIVDYLQVIFKLASDLRVAQYFDYQTLKYLVTTSDNIDSLLFISVNSFYQIDNFFRSTHRSYLSLLAVTGVWIESFYLLTQVQKDNPYVDLRNHIGGQKALLNKLISLLEVYQGHPLFNYLIKQFKQLQQAFAPVKITYEKVKGKTRQVVNGRLVFSQDVSSVIHMDDKTLQNIIKTTAKVRNAVIRMP